MMKNKLKTFLYKQLRKYYLKKITRNYGKIVEHENKIICYVKQNKINKGKQNKVFRHNFLLLNSVDFTLEDKKLIDYFKLDKPVYYIFDNITFKEGLTFYSINANVLFKNCSFYKGIEIPNADTITFENNKYFCRFLMHHSRNSFFYSRSKKLTFLNDHFFNNDKEHHPTKFGMNIETDILEICNTELNSEYPGNIVIEANKTIIKNSKIKAHELYLDSKKIDFLNSSITCKNGLIIENNECDKLKNIDSPIIIYNGVDLTSKKNETIEKKELELKIEREKIIKKLKERKQHCEQLKIRELQKVETNFNNQTIDKVLKR